MHTLLQDLRYAVRQLRQSPGFTLAAVLSLSIGIGANTAIFSVMDGIVMHPLAVPAMDRVLTVHEVHHGDDLRWHVPLADYQDWQRESRSFEDLAVHRSVDMNMTGAGDAAHVQTEYTSINFFSVLRAQPLLGRLFDPSETQPGRGNVTVLSYFFWTHQFNSDPSVLGRAVELDQHTYTVIGVMPKALQYPSTADFYLPFAPDAAQLANRSEHNSMVLGRLRPGVSKAQAQAEMNVLADHLARMYPATNQGGTIQLDPLLDTINGDLTPRYFKLIMGATLFVLLVVCLNIANLQLARGIARQPEIAMRTALGASRGRVLRQLLTENILLGLIGGAGGLLAAQMEMHSSLVAMPARIARYLAGWSTISMNGRALAFSLLLAMVAGFVSGLVPALAALRLNLVDQLKSGSRAVAGAGRTRWMRNVFAVSQIALALALVIGAALMSKGMMALESAADRYDPSHLLTFGVHLPTERYDSPEKLIAWQTASMEKLSALPGVTAAEIATAVPSSDRGWVDDCQIENRPTPPGKFQGALRLPVSNGYFSEFHLALLTGRSQGRFFNASDDLRSTPVAVISQGFAEHYFPGENPLGHRIRFGAGRKDQTPWLSIVGIVEETDYSILGRGHEGAVYMSAAQFPPQGVMFAVKISGNPLALAPAAHKALAGLDASLPLDEVESFSELRHEELIGIIDVARMLNKDALIALLLAAIGIFGVMANQVAERTREIGVRLAMGARREDVMAMILRRASWLTGTGIVLGLLLAFALAHGVASLLYGVRPDDPMIFGGITAAITALALVSSWLPARRAARIDPMVALRDE